MLTALSDRRQPKTITSVSKEKNIFSPQIHRADGNDSHQKANKIKLNFHSKMTSTQSTDDLQKLR